MLRRAVSPALSNRRPLAPAQNAEVAAGARDPRHVVQANIRVGLLGEALDEEEAVEIQQRIREGDVADGCARLEVQGAALIIGRVLRERLELGFHNGQDPATAERSPRRLCARSAASFLPRAINFSVG